MKTKLICWLPKSFYQHDIKCAELLIENNIVPMLDDADTVAIWEAQGKPETLRYIGYGEETKLKPYVDEPISVNKLNQSSIRILCKDYPDLVIGETSTETIKQLVDAGCKSITYTCYGWHLFRMAGINIRMPFTTQLRTWDRLERKYNYCFNGYGYVELDDSIKKFSMAWIMLDQTKSFKKLISWCIAHNKTIGLVAPDNKKNNPEWVKEHLELFINAYKEVVK